VSNPDRIPVIVGVAQVVDRPANVEDGLDSIGLMLEALRAAERDSGASLLDRLDWLGVMNQISFPDPDEHIHLAERLGRTPATLFSNGDPSGDGPIRLINDAANAIASGKAKFAAAVGGEAMRTANKRAQMAAAQAPAGGKLDLMMDKAAELALPHARPYGLFTPAEVYPIYEQATRAAWGQSIDEAQAETAAIWAGNSRVAADNPGAWLRDPVPAERIREVTADNRMVAFPYTKLMVANNSVNQGAAVLMTSLATARGLGIPEERLVYVGRGAAAAEPDDYLRRDSFAKSASMTATLEKALAFNGLEPRDLDHAELYSCFPCIPKMSRRILDWPLDKPASLYGGLTFGGGPVGNCMMHAAASLVDKLRGKAKGNGLIFANGGFASHNHAIILSRTPGPEADEPHSYDVQAEAEAARGPAPAFLDHYAGPATIESYTIPYDRKGEPRFATVVGRTPNGERFLAHVPGDDRATIDVLTGSQGEPVGRAGVAVAMDDGRQRWTLG
jgi:acetyl-CoA C-acetyltransferase